MTTPSASEVPVPPTEVPAPVLELARAARRVCVLSGAGMSAESGVPTFRDQQVGLWQQYDPLEIASPTAWREAPERVWAWYAWRASMVRRAEPNAGHRAIGAWQGREGVQLDVVTQNVDGLHERAGSRRLVALHGRVADVVCLGCRRTTPRAALQDRLDAANPGWLERHADVAARPDGDVDLEQTEGFVVPGCEECAGVLKPDVVFFGENVPKHRVERCYAAVDALVPAGGALLVAGSSLAVMSGLRFVRRAAKQGTPVVIVNRGATRGDDLATYAVDAGTSGFLGDLAGGA